MLHARMPDEAYEFCQDAVDLDRESVLGHWCLGRTFLGKHQPDRAIPELRRTVDLGRVSYFRRDLACAQAATGDREPALRLLAEFRAQKDFRLYYDSAALYSALGNRRAALDSLEACYAAHCRKLIFAGIEPAFESFRSDPEFQNLIRRVTHLH
jgi:tetratricopeptide (TPR) repeat protein